MTVQDRYAQMKQLSLSMSCDRNVMDYFLSPQLVHCGYGTKLESEIETLTDTYFYT